MAGILSEAFRKVTSKHKDARMKDGVNKCEPPSDRSKTT